MKTCRHCGEQIAIETATGWWKHVFTDLYLCKDEIHMAEPR